MRFYWETMSLALLCKICQKSQTTIWSCTGLPKKQYLVNIDDWLTKQADPNKPAGISQVRNDTDRQSYLQAIEKIKNAIDSGDTYQINYTVRLHLRAYGNPIRLYQRLRQPVPYAVLANLPDSAGKTAWTLSFSPEQIGRAHV